ncbi:hypothetical protein OIU85_003352 [Salix viminalis]|uniref:Xylanase inhibitor N-terminal domain-containing protein n=1 Tax=Salix viminalis TaxID=40686 RepID=A0A9Q0PZI6_SALVM|nr:hypothetical protein OIU85_003352 [Salix viminalis]
MIKKTILLSTDIQLSMAKLAVPLLILFFLLSFIPSQAALPLHTPIQKDHSTGQYIISAYLKTPLKLTKLVLDLGATYSWVNCDDYISSTYQHIPCNSSIANSLSAYACMDTCEDPPGPNCGNNSFSFLLDNPIKAVDYRKVNGINAALVDSLALPNTQGSLVSISNFIFSCARTGFLKGLAKGVTGLAALGNSNLSIPVQINKGLPFLSKLFCHVLVRIHVSTWSGSFWVVKGLIISCKELTSQNHFFTLLLFLTRLEEILIQITTDSLLNIM